MEMDTEDFQKWMLQSEEEEQLDIILQGLLHIAKEDHSERDEESGARAFAKFKDRVGFSEKRQNMGQRTFPFFSAVAAAIMVPLFILSFVLIKNSKETAAITVWNEIFTTFSEHTQIILSDGTQVDLGPCSRIIYPSKFAGSERKVFVTGDLLFDVAKNPDKCFVVSAECTETTVYGTSFHISSRNDRSDDEIALLEGSVQLRSKDGSSCTQVVPGQLVRYDKLSGSTRVSEFDIQSYRNVMSSGGIQFIDQTLSEISRQLSRLFGIEIAIVGDGIQTERYYATFVNGEDLSTILEALNVDKNFSIKHIDNKSIKLIEK